MLRNVKLWRIAQLAVAMLSMFTARPCLAAEVYSFQGHGGTMGHLGFYLIGGEYQIYVRAQLPLADIRSGVSHSCIFSSLVQWPNSTTVPVGRGVTVTNFVPFKLQTVLHTLSAGDYHFWVVAGSTCDWVMNIVSTNQNTPGIAPVQMLRTTAGNVQGSSTASVSDQVEFYAQYRTENDAQTPVSGVVQIINAGKVVQTFPLKVGKDPSTKANLFYDSVQWEPSDAKYLGKNIAKFVVKIGSTEFTSSGEFTLTR